jgi:hypothetical protein
MRIMHISLSLSRLSGGERARCSGVSDVVSLSRLSGGETYYAERLPLKFFRRFFRGWLRHQIRAHILKTRRKHYGSGLWAEVFHMY